MSEAYNVIIFQLQWVAQVVTMSIRMCPFLTLHLIVNIDEGIIFLINPEGSLDKWSELSPPQVLEMRDLKGP